MCLLYEHGGLWIDATVYVSQLIPEKVFQEPLFTVAANIDTDNISQAKWMGFILGSSPQGVLCSFARELFFQYWEKENKLLDYFLIDYVISIAKTNLASVRRSLNSIPTDHSQIFDLENMMNKAYKRKLFSKTLCEQQIFHKLSYKNKHAQYTNKGVRTLYHMLISNNYFYALTFSITYFHLLQERSRYKVFYYLFNSILNLLSKNLYFPS